VCLPFGDAGSHALLRRRRISLSFGARLNFLCPLVNSFTLLRANNPDLVLNTIAAMKPERLTNSANYCLGFNLMTARTSSNPKAHVTLTPIDRQQLRRDGLSRYACRSIVDRYVVAKRGPIRACRNRAARDVNIPDVPELRSGRLSAMLIVDRCGSHLFCLSSVGRGRRMWLRPLIAHAGSLSAKRARLKASVLPLRTAATKASC
jgi:hypothetical protein